MEGGDRAKQHHLSHQGSHRMGQCSGRRAYLQAEVHGGLRRVHDEVPQGEAEAILETFAQEQCPRPLPGEGAPRRAPISRAQWQLREHRETGVSGHVAHTLGLHTASCSSEDMKGAERIPWTLGFQAPSFAPDLSPSVLSHHHQPNSFFLLSLPSLHEAFATRGITHCHESGVGSAEFSKCSLSTYYVPGTGHTTVFAWEVPAAI